MPELVTRVACRAPFLPYLNRAQRWACVVAHRRAGKTVACVMDLIVRAGTCEKREPRFAYIAPTFGQAKDVAWTYLKEYTAHIPGMKVSETELSVQFPHNGARIRLYGAENYDRLRGLYLDGAVIDEAGDQDPRAFPEVIRPALSDRKGWATFIGTPKGRNEFYRIYQRAQGSDDWMTATLRASETALIPNAELSDARAMMTPEQYRREYECDFTAAIVGAYFAEMIETARNEHRVGNLAADPLLSVRAYWDIGGTGAKADATAIWLVQFVGKEIRVLNYYEASGQPLATHVEWLRLNGYDKVACVLPHDGSSNDKVHDASYESALKAAGFPVIVIPNQGKGAAMARVEAVRRLLPQCWFDVKTESGLDALGWYHERRDEARNIGLGPEHDWSSHAADAFGLMAIAYEKHTEARPNAAQFKIPPSRGGWLAG